MFFKRNRSAEDQPDHEKQVRETGPLQSQSGTPPTVPQPDETAPSASAAPIDDDYPKTMRLEHQAFSSMLDLTPAPDWSRKGGEFTRVPKNANPDTDYGFDWSLELKTPLNTEQPLRLHILGDVVLGRTDLADVDLEGFDASNKGVSRRHALLRPTSHQLYLIELGSTNGTMLNGMPLGPGMARPLRSEDVITLGDLRLTVRLYGGPTKRPNVSVVDMYAPDVLDKSDRK